MNRFTCKCLFDITATGVVGHFKGSRVPFKDRAGQMITNEETWNRSRNQQRNWETLTQLLSLRTQLHEVTEPVLEDGAWQFDFATETADVYGTPADPTAVLRADADGVPMILNLDNGEIMASVLIVSGVETNIWFHKLAVNTELG